MSNKEFSTSATYSNEQQMTSPFFAKYLENQNSLTVKTNLKAGATLKYPSDRDEWDN